MEATSKYVPFKLLTSSDQESIIKGIMMKYGISEIDAKFRAGLQQYLVVQQGATYVRIT